MSADEINRACAERLGWKCERKDSGCYKGLYFLKSPQGKQRGGFWKDSFSVWTQQLHGYPKIPNFHGSMDAAMQLVEFAREMGCEFNIYTLRGGYRVQFMAPIKTDHSIGKEIYQSDSLSPSAAICESFLKLHAKEAQ